MCLGIPGLIVETYDESGVPMALVDFGGATKKICLAYAPEADIGDHAIVHAGFAIALVDEQAAAAALDLWADIDDQDATVGDGS
jgi:hydrogenase expression/formation protein HypC